MKTARVELIIEPELKEKAKRVAKKRKRSLNNFIETTLEEEVKRDEAEEADN